MGKFFDQVRAQLPSLDTMVADELKMAILVLQQAADLDAADTGECSGRKPTVVSMPRCNMG
jgi:hypothetical protein